ncbi:unannotated protein [freshwater metagenome]
MHVLDADGAAIRVTEDAEDVAQLLEWLAAEAACRELAIEVPECEPVAGDVEIGVAALGVLERIGVGHQVPAHAEGVDEFLDP